MYGMKRKERYADLAKEFSKALDNFFSTKISTQTYSTQYSAYTIGDKYLKLALPGNKADEVEITEHEDILTVKAKNPFYGDLEMSFTLNNSKVVRAVLKDGVLTITFDVPEGSKPKKLEISTEEQ